MHEKEFAHWAGAAVKADEEYAGAHLTALTCVPERMHTLDGFARCSVKVKGHVAGIFYLRWKGTAKELFGYLIKGVDHMYEFPPRKAPGDAEWPFLVEFTKRALDCNYKFPPDMEVVYSHHDISAYIRGPKGGR